MPGGAGFLPSTDLNLIKMLDSSRTKVDEKMSFPTAPGPPHNDTRTWRRCCEYSLPLQVNIFVPGTLRRPLFSLEKNMILEGSFD